ncbi:MAG: hypothetical protein KDJ88_08620 [Bauldia sp.]|nr:hypothetical protein [Bauldia sp.]
MTILRGTLLAMSAAVTFGSMAIAGPVQDFEKDMRAAYGDYRGALFFTNANKPEQAAKAVADFEQKWDALAADYAAAPPHYADDPAYKETLAKVSEIAKTAAGEVADGKLPAAHETLEAIRDQIGGLHMRNGVISFSDRMNAYHAEMEHVLGRDYGNLDAVGMAALVGDAAVLHYLAMQIADHPPADATDNPAFEAAMKPFMASVEALQTAVQSGDAAAAKKAIGGLKPPYSKLFLQFG